MINEKNLLWHTQNIHKNVYRVDWFKFTLWQPICLPTYLLTELNTTQLKLVYHNIIISKYQNIKISKYHNMQQPSWKEKIKHPKPWQPNIVCHFLILTTLTLTTHLEIFYFIIFYFQEMHFNFQQLLWYRINYYTHSTVICSE